MDKKNRQMIYLYWVEAPVNIKNRWFDNKKDAIYYAKSVWDLEDDEIVMNHPPIYEHPFFYDSNFIANFLSDISPF